MELGRADDAEPNARSMQPDSVDGPQSSSESLQGKRPGSARLTSPITSPSRKRRYRVRSTRKSLSKASNPEHKSPVLSVLAKGLKNKVKGFKSNTQKILMLIILLTTIFSSLAVACVTLRLLHLRQQTPFVWSKALPQQLTYAALPWPAPKTGSTSVLPFPPGNQIDLVAKQDDPIASRFDKLGSHIYLQFHGTIGMHPCMQGAVAAFLNITTAMPLHRTPIRGENRGIGVQIAGNHLLGLITTHISSLRRTKTRGLVQVPCWP
eukprot:6206646-Pleurochrysis_carterae.AAC.2